MYFTLEDHYYTKGKPDGLINIISNMQINDKDKTMDPAYWGDWIIALEIDNPEKALFLTPEEGYEAMVKFVENYFVRGLKQERDIEDMLTSLTKKKSFFFNKWLKKIEFVHTNAQKVRNMIPEKLNKALYHLQ